jgi:hypothetical protein
LVLFLAVLCGAVMYGTLAMEWLYVSPLDWDFWHGPFELEPQIAELEQRPR